MYVSESKLSEYLRELSMGSTGAAAKKSFGAEHKLELGKKLDRGHALADVSEFFDTVLPLEFSNRPWYAKFWIKMLERPSLHSLSCAVGGAVKLYCEEVDVYGI